MPSPWSCLRAAKFLAPRSSPSHRLGGTGSRGGGEQRALVESGDVIGDEAGGAEAMIEDFHLDLAAVGVAGERKLNAEFRGAIETELGLCERRILGMSRRTSGSTPARVCCAAGRREVRSR